MEPLVGARLFRLEEISEGMRQEREYMISQHVYEHFMASFDDRSPIHVDSRYARDCGFSSCVAHGGILNGFLSHFIGMYFPGSLSLLLTTDLRFGNPSYIGDHLKIEAIVKQTNENQRIVVLDLIFTNVTQGLQAARGRAQVMVREGQ